MREKIAWKGSDKPLVTGRFRKSRAVPTSRLLQRLNLGKYEAHASYGGELFTGKVVLPLGQHIGAPAICIVSVGDKVRVGDLVGEIPEGAMGARVHASIDGVVESIGDGKVTIRA